jgi:hypothetical protein
VLLKKYPWFGYIAKKAATEKAVFGVKVIEDDHVIEEWTLTENNFVITKCEKGIKNLDYSILGFKLDLVISQNKKIFERWVVEEEDLVKHPILRSIRYGFYLIMGAKIYREYH